MTDRVRASDARHLRKSGRLPATFWHALLFWLFALALLLFPFGQIFRTLLPVLCLIPLCVLYVTDWEHCNLRFLPVWWLWLLFFACIALAVLGSSWHGASWSAVRPNLFRGFALPFIALECVRGEKDLRRLVGVFAVTAALEGLAGVWQFGTGQDLFSGTVPLGLGNVLPFEPGSLDSLRHFRLTGSMSTYRVGNYLALLLLPACGLYALWPERGRSGRPVPRVLLTVLLLSPALFLLLGAQTRSALLSSGAGLYLVWVIAAKPGWKALLVPVAGVCLLLFGPDRISWARMLADERVLIWTEGWKCFLAHPLLGTGANTFPLACAELGISHLPNGSHIPPHPHNIYLQWLIDGGLVGFVLLSVWAYGLLAWSGRRIHKGLRGLAPWDAAHGIYWRLTLCFWGGWLVYLLEGFAAHGFYRTWWVSTAFSILGVLLGACVHAERAANPPAIREVHNVHADSARAR